MINNDTATIALTAPGHGIFRVRADHLTLVLLARGEDPLPTLHAEIASLVGVGGYEDLDRASALVVLSYLTGGCSDD